MDRYKGNNQSGRRYQQLLEDEQKSLGRNRNLLEDIDKLEDQIKHFNSKHKQDEDRLKQAKDKFLQYVKSVYPKWMEDVKKWQEDKKRPSHDVQNETSVDLQSDLHQTSNRPHLAERSPSTFSFSRNNPHGDNPHRDNPHRDNPHRDNPQRDNPHQYLHDSLLDNTRERGKYPRDVTGRVKDMMGIPKDTMGYSRNRMGYHAEVSPDGLRSSKDRMMYQRDIMNSSRDTMENSSVELGYLSDSMGYLRDDMRYPGVNVYNSRPWMYPQHSSPGTYPHPTHPYFHPMLGAYGGPRWSTPSYMYDHWSMPNTQSRRFHEEFSEKERFSQNRKERPQNTSFERDENTLPNARNGECYADRRNPDDINSHRRDGPLSPEISLAYERHPHSNKPSGDATTRAYHDPNLSLGRPSQDNESYERNAANYPAKPPRDTARQYQRLNQDVEGPNQETNRFERYPHLGKPSRDVTRQYHDTDQGLERSNQETGGSVSVMGQTDHAAYSDNLDPLRQTTTDGGGYLDQPRKDTRMMQLKSEGSGWGSKEAINTDSISLPTIHQYEGDIRDIFSDLSNSEDLNQDDSRQSQARNLLVGTSGNSQDGRSLANHNQSQVRNLKEPKGSKENQVATSGISQDGSSVAKLQTRHLNEPEYFPESQVGTSENSPDRSSPRSHKQSQGSDSGELKDSKRNQVGTFGYSQDGSNLTNPKQSQRRYSRDNKVELSESSKGSFAQKESRPSAVEDLIGDDVSDFEVSETEVSDNDLATGEPHETVAEDDRVEHSGLRNEKSVTQHQDAKRQNDIPNLCTDPAKEARKNGLPNETPSSNQEVKDLSGELEVSNDNKEDVYGFDHSNNTSISEELAKSENISSQRKTGRNDNERRLETDIKDGENTEGIKVDSSLSGRLGHNEHEQIIEIQSQTNPEKNLPCEEGDSVESKEKGIDVEANQVKTRASTDNEGEERHSEVSERENLTEGSRSIEEEIVEEVHDDVDVEEVKSDDEKSKSGVLEEISYSSAESSSESVPAQKVNASKSDTKSKESLSYSEDFEEERSIPLTQSAAYQKMLHSVDVSDEDDDIEEVFLQGTMSEANTTAQSTLNMPQTLRDSAGSPSQVKLPSKSKPTLSLFSSGEKDELGDSFGKEKAGALSPSWKSSEGSLSPPLSPDTGGYVPSVAAGTSKAEKGGEGSKEKEVPAVGERKSGKVETGNIQAKPQESNTKSRIQAGFWNDSESESEVDLQISHGGNENKEDDDDDFDFYS